MAKKRDNGYEAYARRRRAQRRRHSHYGYYANLTVGGTRKRGFPLWLMGAIAAGAVGAIVVVSVLTAGLMVYDSYASDLVPPDELAINQPSYGAIILDRNDTVLYEYVDDKAGLRRPTPIQDISRAFLAATISTEDDSFFTNPGVNFQGLARAAWENSPFGDTEVFGGSGGSSITQQLVKNVYIDESARSERWSSDGISRKVQEMVYAMELTDRYEKSKILEWYVNQISYGGVFNGVEAAALGYFGKPASELTLGEAALLAGIPQSPAAYDPVNQRASSLERRNQVLDLMLRQSPIQIGEDDFFVVTEADVEAAKAEEVVIVSAQFQIEAPHWVLSYIEPQLRAMLGCPSRLDMLREVIAGTRNPLLGRPGEGCDALFTQGLIVKTTLDLEMQKHTTEILEKWVREYEAATNTRNGSIMVMDPHTAEILVMVGSRDYYREDIDGRNNNALACNSPGSSFKPFVYLTTFEEMGWGPGTYMLDNPITYTDALGNTFTPRNPIGDFAGPVTIRSALGNSLNIPANKAVDAVGSQTVVNLGRRVGFVDTFRLDGCANRGGYGPAMGTGGMDVTLEEMMYGYSTLATGGIMRGQEPVNPHDDDERQADPVSILHIVDNEGVVRWDIRDKIREFRVIDPGYAYLLWDVLIDSSARCRTFGCGLNVDNYTAAVKTGTSAPYSENDPVCAGRIGETWAFGYSPDLVVGVWAGNADNSCLTDITSATLAFRAMNETFNYAHQGKAVTQFQRPGNVVTAEVCVPSGLKPTEHCRVKSRDLWVEGDVPKQEDTWWREVTLDIRNGKLAAPNTPSMLTEKKVMLVLPDAWLGGSGPSQDGNQRQRAEEWARALNIELAPTEVSDGTGEIPGGGLAGTQTSEAAIFSPIIGSRVNNLVQIIGRAEAPNFVQYRLEFGKGSNPEQWTTIQTLRSPQRAGLLGLWNVANLEPGGYTLRLVVQTRNGDEFVAVVPVIVNE